MKKRMFLSILVAVFFASCGKEREQKEKPQEEVMTSIENTTWMNRRDRDDGTWVENKLVFSSDLATYHRMADYGSTEDRVDGTFSYDPPTVTIYEDIIDPQGKPAVRRHTGTVNGNTMNIDIMTGDILWSLELKLQK